MIQDLSRMVLKCYGQITYVAREKQDKDFICLKGKTGSG